MIFTHVSNSYLFDGMPLDESTLHPLPRTTRLLVSCRKIGAHFSHSNDSFEKTQVGIYRTCLVAPIKPSDALNESLVRFSRIWPGARLRFSYRFMPDSDDSEVFVRIFVAERPVVCVTGLARPRETLEKFLP